MSNFDANFHCDESEKEFPMQRRMRKRRRENGCIYSTSNFLSDGCCKIDPDRVRNASPDSKKMINKNVTNVRNALNKMKHVGGGGENVTCEVLLKVEKELSRSLFLREKNDALSRSPLLSEKNDVEKINATRKELQLQNFEPKSQNTERKNLDGLLGRKRCIRKDAKEETSPKEVDFVDSEWKDINEKGQLDIVGTEKTVTMEEEEVVKLLEIDDHGQCSGDGGKVELISGENEQETEEVCSLCEKWECEEEEKVETGRTLTPNGELENEKKVDSGNSDEAYEYSKVQIYNMNIQQFASPDEAYEYSKVFSEDLFEGKTCVKNEKVSLIGQCSSTVNCCENEKGEQVNAPESEKIDLVINGQQPCVAVRHLQVAEEEVGLGIPGHGKEEEDAFCPSPARSIEAFGSFKSHGGNLIATESSSYYSWICVSYSPAEPACRKSPVSHSDEGQGRSNHTSSSFGRYGGEGSSGGAGGFVSSGLGGGGGGSGGGGNGRGGDDGRNGGNNRRQLEFSDGSRKGKAKKKLRKKCRLEHGVLTKDQISAVIGWFADRQGRSVPDALREFLKCFKICFEDRTDARSDCEPCLALCVLLTHCGGCSVEACDRCDIVLTLYFISLTVDKNGLVPSPSPLLTPDARQDGLRRIRADLAEWLLSDGEGSLTGSDGDRSLSDFDFDSDSKEETEDRMDGQMVEVESIADSKGPPAIKNFEDEQCVSEYPPYPNYPSSNTVPGRTCLYSMPTYPRYARRGSVIYGSKDLVRRFSEQLNDVANEQRGNRQNSPLQQQLASRVGVILQLHSGNLRIQSNNYELGEEWNFLTDKALGSGVSGSCFVGHDDQTDFAFCVKRIQIHKFNASEVLIWLDMEHQDIAEFYGIVAYDEYVFILQELIRGPTLKERIMTNKALNTFEALTYLQHLLTLLEYLKRKGVLHNDIKADNLLLREPSTSTRLVLIDFGLANQTVFVPSGIPPEGGQTQWSPEKAASEGYGFPADLWAAVALFVHMLAGFEPWVVRFKTAGFLHFIIKQHSPPLQDIPEDIPQEVRDLIVSGWTVDPSIRPTAADLLNHEAFRLLGDLFDPSAELFTRHLSTVGSAEQEDEPNYDEILDESETEELISLVQQRFSINQSFPENQRMLTSIRTQFDSTAPRYASSGGSSIAGERPPAVEISSIFHPVDRVMSLRTAALTSLRETLPRLEEETQDLIAEEEIGFGFKSNSPKSGRRRSSALPNDDDLDLMVKYDDLSLPMYLLNIPEDGEVLSSNQLEIASSRQIPVLHNSNLKDTSSYLIANPAPIPAAVEDLSTSLDDEDVVMFISNEDKKDYVDSKKDCCRGTSKDDQPISMGTTIRMYLGNDQVYCIHLHPGTESSWSEIFRRASTEIHERQVAAFTAELRVGNQTAALDISSVIPSEHELQVVIVHLNPFQEHGWTWKVEESRITYHASYQWNFSPEFD